MRIPLSTLFLILPYLASEAAALPSLRRPRAFRRAGGDASHEWTQHDPYAEEAPVVSAVSASESASAVAVSQAPSATADIISASASVSVSIDPSYTGIPVASETGNPSDYLPFSETARTLVPLSDVPSSAISSLLAETSRFSTFTYTDYQPQTESASPQETQATVTQAPAPAPTGNWGDETSGNSGEEEKSGDDKDSINQGLLRQALGGIKSYAESLIGAAMPTVTFEVVLQPTQVSRFFYNIFGMGHGLNFSYPMVTGTMSSKSDRMARRLLSPHTSLPPVPRQLVTRGRHRKVEESIPQPTLLQQLHPLPAGPVVTAVVAVVVTAAAETGLEVKTLDLLQPNLPPIDQTTPPPTLPLLPHHPLPTVVMILVPTPTRNLIGRITLPPTVLLEQLLQPMDPMSSDL
jgi:hypothetical protein